MQIIKKIQNIKKNKQVNLHLPLKTFVAGVRETREGYCVGLLLSLTESLPSIGSMELFLHGGPLYTLAGILPTVPY